MYLTRFRINTARPEAQRLLTSPHRLHGAVNMAFPEPPPRDGTGPRVLWRLDPAPAGRHDLLISSPDRPDLTHLAEQAGWPSLGQEGWKTFAYGEFLDTLTEGGIWAFRLTANPVHHIRRAQDPVGTPTKRAAHITVRHQVGWLLKQEERRGFAVLRTPLSPVATAEDVTFFADKNGTVREQGLPSVEGGKPGPVNGAGTTAESSVATSTTTQETDRWGYQLVVHNRTPVRFGKPTGSSSHNPRHGIQFTQATFDGLLRITDIASFRRTLTQGLGKAKAYGCGLMTLAPLR
ncbi:type I-E CRISPR-associated protein Cas6/Cse3/CasE [Streptomyces sp. NPDC000405]|uniref:type I-E CRISPR-associated protein Cas6/Cse3/CasE n=1 Tax=Streptomyces sp. NPDC000405 TaxID=3161033 RepID=UPI00398CFBD4